MSYIKSILIGVKDGSEIVNKEASCILKGTSNGIEKLWAKKLYVKNNYRFSSYVVFSAGEHVDHFAYGYGFYSSGKTDEFREARISFKTRGHRKLYINCKKQIYNGDTDEYQNTGGIVYIIDHKNVRHIVDFESSTIQIDLDDYHDEEDWYYLEVRLNPITFDAEGKEVYAEVGLRINELYLLTY